MLGKLASLKPVLMIVAAAGGTLTASGSFASFEPYLAAASHRLSPGSFLLSANPTSISIPQGSSGVSTITVTSLNRFSGNVALSILSAGSGLHLTFTKTTVTVRSRGLATSNLNVTASAGTATGDYIIAVIGTSTQSRTTMSSSTSLLVHVGTRADFTIDVQPNALTEIAGYSGSVTVVLTSHYGFNGSVSLSATVPFGYIGVMGGVNPVLLAPNGTNSSSLRISTTGSTQPGAYVITVTGSGGGHTHSSQVVLTVVDPVAEFLVVTGWNFNSNTNLTLYIRNNGSRPVTLTSYAVKDFAGDAWLQVNWAGPVLAPGSISDVNIVIGASCPNCTYVWVIGLFPQFIQEQTYTIVLTTANSNQFSFNVRY